MNTPTLPIPNRRPTFLFTDIVDSSPMSNEFGAEGYREKLQGPHDVVVRDAAARYNGYEDSTTGDSFLLVFETAADALNCAHAIRDSLRDNPITAKDANGTEWRVLVRIGVHTAIQEVPHSSMQPYRSLPDVNLASRVMSQARGGQIFVSEETHRVASNAAECRWHTWTYCVLKGQTPELQTLFEPLWDDEKTAGEPKERSLPPTFRVEINKYIPRPELEADILKHLERLPDTNQPTRLVTLWGFGGMGKTRLAIECALRAGRAFPDGVYFVPLADRLPSAQSLVEAIGEALNVERAVTLADLLPALRDKALLLTLDNYESVHCPEAQAFLRDLLRETDKVRLLLTAREAAHLFPAEKTIAIEGLTDEQARELFIARARLLPRRDQWEPTTNAEQEALDYILTQTDCIPLAIELLAAWMGKRAIGQIAADLKANPLPALPKGYLGMDTAERNRSLTHCFDYSYNMLDDNLKRGFALLSLFADSWDADTAAAACGIPDAQDVLDELHLKALITRTDVDDTASRYGMLHEARAYDALHFAALPDADAIRERYTRYYAQLAEDNRDINDLTKQVILEKEWRNAIAAADCAEACGFHAGVWQMSSALADFLYLHGRLMELQNLTLRALDAACRANNRTEEGTAWNNLGGAYQLQGNLQEAMKCHQNALPILHETGNRKVEGHTLNNLGVIYKLLENWQEAEQYYQQCLTVYRETEDRPSEGSTLKNLGNLYQEQGKLQEAAEFYKEALLISREVNDRVGEGQTLRCLGIVYVEQANWQEAEHCYQQALAVFRKYGAPLEESRTLLTLASLRGKQDDIPGAIDYARQALAVLETTQDVDLTEAVRKWIAELEALTP